MLVRGLCVVNSNRYGKKAVTCFGMKGTTEQDTVQWVKSYFFALNLKNYIQNT